MSGSPPDPALRGVADAYAVLFGRLRDIAGPADRRIAIDAVRDALDREAAVSMAEPRFVAHSYAVEGTIHRGAHFEVLRLRQRDLGTLHALKTPVTERCSDPLLRRLIRTEAVHQALVVHPTCLPFRALLRLDDGRPGLLTDLVEAPTLSAILARRSLTDREALSLARRLADALGAVHAAGFVHGDLSPANLFLPNGDPGRAILFDFGLSRRIGTSGEEDLDHAATNGFAAPETCDRTSGAHPAADLFSLGQILLRARASTAHGPLADLAHDLLLTDPSARPHLAETVRRLEACGEPATDDLKNERSPETDQLAPL